jgi:hypothetical protein
MGVGADGRAFFFEPGRMVQITLLAPLLVVVVLASADPDPEHCSGTPPSVNKTILNARQVPAPVLPLLSPSNTPVLPSRHSLILFSFVPCLAHARYTFAQVAELNLVPFPSGATTVSPAYLPLTPRTTTIAVAAPTPDGATLVHPLALLLADEIKAATSGAVVPITATLDSHHSSTVQDGALPTQTILLQLQNPATGPASTPTSTAAPDETYSLSVHPTTGAVVTSTSYSGLVAGTITLLQAIEYSEDTDAAGWITPQNCTTAPKWRVPALTVADDTPALPYRAMMVYSARF